VASRRAAPQPKPSTEKRIPVRPNINGLRRHGWVEGHNVIITPVYAMGDYSRLPALANELKSKSAHHSRWQRTFACCSKGKPGTTLRRNSSFLPLVSDIWFARPVTLPLRAATA
jgi:hypothetical protein